MRKIAKMTNVELNEVFDQKKWTKNLGRRIKRERIFTVFSLLKRLQITLPENRILRIACLGFLTRFVVFTVGIRFRPTTILDSTTFLSSPQAPKFWVQLCNNRVSSDEYLMIYLKFGRRIKRRSNSKFLKVGRRNVELNENEIEKWNCQTSN